MRNVLRIMTYAALAACSLLCFSSCLGNLESKEEYTYTFDDATATYMGEVDDQDTSKGSYWEITFESESVLEGHLYLVCEHNTETFTEGTYKCLGYNAQTITKNTFIPGNTSGGAPIYSYFITAYDGSKYYYCLVTDGTAVVSKSETEGEHIIQGTLKSYNATINLGFSGKISINIDD